MESSPPIRVGIIGLGQIALKAHLPGYNKSIHCQLTAVHSLRENHAKKVATQYGIQHIYKNLNQLLESKFVDAVSICTPNFTHAPIALKALKEGKHVLVEKPIALNQVEAKKLIRAAKKAGRVLMVHHNMRFDPAVRTAANLLRKNTIGDVFAFNSSLVHKGPLAWSPKANWFFNRKKSGGGALMDLGPHVFDSLSYLLQDHPLMVGAVATDGKEFSLSKGHFQKFNEIHCCCLLRFKRGAVGSVTVGWGDTTYQNHFYFFGTKGTLSLNLAKGDPITLEYRDKTGKHYPPLDKNSFEPSIYQHFIDCIREGKTPLVSGTEGLNTLKLIETGYKFINRRMVAVI